MSDLAQRLRQMRFDLIDGVIPTGPTLTQWLDDLDEVVNNFLTVKIYEGEPCSFGERCFGFNTPNGYRYHPPPRRKE